MKRNVFQSLLTLSLVASTLTACGMGTPTARYIPTQAPPAQTVIQNQLPAIQVSNKQPTLPDGKSATAIRFDMDYESSSSSPDPLASANPAATPNATASSDPNAATTAEPQAAPLQPQADEMNVPVGTTKQFTVEITLDDGSLLSSYSRVNWVSTNRDVGTISSSGTFTPRLEGTTKVVASIGGVAVTMVVHVVPGHFIWQQMAAPTKANLYGVKMVSDTEAWAVGAGGTMLHYLRGQWYNLTNQLNPVTQGANLYSIDMLSPMEGYAVGDNTILQFANGVWTRLPVPTQGSFKSIDMLAPGLGWIVGDSGGTAVALTLRGPMGWQPMPTGIDRPLNAVSVIGPNHVWAVGESGNLHRPGIYQFNGSTWEKVKFTNSLIDWKLPTGSYSMKDIKMVNSSQGWAVGTYDPLLSSIRGERGAIFKYDAINDIWSEVSLNDNVDKRYAQVTYNAIGMKDPNEGWILGNTVTAALDFSANPEVNGNLMKTDGETVSPASDFQAQSLPQAFNSIDVVQHGNGIIVGDQGLIMHHQYDPNYRYQQNNFGNFSGQYGQGYTPVNVGTPIGY